MSGIEYIFRLAYILNKMQGKASKKQKKAVNDKLRFTEKEVAEGLKQASRHHIESFDYAMQTCLPRIC
jgi:hypothetical protein